MKIDSGAWILVADGEKYLLLRNAGSRGRLALQVVDRGVQENPPTREQGSDRPGRLDDPGPGRSAIEPTDWHRLGKERFGKELAERLRLWALDGQFRSLVLVADPRTLGVLRPLLHREVTERLAGEISKDLTGQPVPGIEAALAAA